MRNSIRLKIIIMAFTTMTVMVFFSSCAGKGNQPPADAVPEIHALLDRQVEAWNRHDLEGFMAGYWDSPDLTFFSGGTTVAGWKSTLDRYHQRYQSNGAEMGQLDFSDLRIETLGPASAFVRGRWHLKLTAGEAGGLFTLTLRKFDEGWRIIHDHTSSP